MPTMPSLSSLPPPPPGKNGWPWTIETPSCVPAPGMSVPKISIVTPSYNQGCFLEETIRSVLLQGYPHLEYVVMDGGSTDESAGILKKYSPWLTHWRSEKDAGQANAINKGLRIVSGDILAYINSDDWYHPGAFQTVAARFHDHPEERWWVGRVDNRLGDSSEAKWSGATSLPRLLGRRETIYQPGTFWHREAGSSAGFFDETLHLAFDHEYFVRMLATGFSPVNLEAPIANFRLHSSSKTSNLQHAAIRELKEIARRYRQLLNPGQWRETRRFLKIFEADYLIDNAYALMQRGKRAEAIGYLLSRAGLWPCLQSKRAYAGALARGIAGMRPPAWYGEKNATPVPMVRTTKPAARMRVLFDRILKSIRWRVDRAGVWLNGCLARCGPRVFIMAHWPWPMRKPFERSRLRIISFGGGMGDELMCVPIFAEIKRKNPRCKITFVSRHPDLFQGNPDIDSIERWNRAATRDLCVLRYQHAIPPPRPLITLMAEWLGLEMNATRLLPPRVQVEEPFRREIAAIPRPRLVIQPLTSRWTPNKSWPLPDWIELIRLLVAEFDVIEAGTESAFPELDFGPRFHSFAGRTDLQAFAWLISQADAFVGPVSSGMHLANAFRIPSVIIFGGYESPAGFLYEGMEALFTPVECAPCWLNEPCPYGLKCMKAIRPADVLAAIHRTLPGASANQPVTL